MGEEKIGRLYVTVPFPKLFSVRSLGKKIREAWMGVAEGGRENFCRAEDIYGL